MHLTHSTGLELILVVRVGTVARLAALAALEDATFAGGVVRRVNAVVVAVLAAFPRTALAVVVVGFAVLVLGVTMVSHLVGWEVGIVGRE